MAPPRCRECADWCRRLQAWELTARLLEDRCEPVQRSAAELLLPVVTRWASQLGRLSDRLVPHALNAARQAAQVCTGTGRDGGTDRVGEGWGNPQAPKFQVQSVY